MTAIERLEEMLNAKDAELEEMQQRMQEAEEKAEADHTWTRHLTFNDPTQAPSPNLPVPRLEIRWVESITDGYEVEARYSLVYRHLLGHIVFVPLGLTRSTGALYRRVGSDGSVDTPFRDGAHLRNEMQQLGLRAFGIVGDHVEEYVACKRCGRLSSPKHPASSFTTCALPPLEPTPSKEDPTP